MSTAVWVVVGTMFFAGLLGGLMAFPKVGKQPRVRIGLGTVHTVLHLVPLAALLVVLLACTSAHPAAALPASIAFGFIWGPTAFTLYLAWAIRRPHHPHANEVFAAQSQTIGKGHKNFMRMKIDAGGAVTIYPIGVRSVPAAADWEPVDRPDAPPPPAPHVEPPWFQLKEGEIAVELIEDPIEVSGPE